MSRTRRDAPLNLALATPGNWLVIPHWCLVWDGNDSQAGQRRYRAAIKTVEYAALVEVLRCGRPNVQTELALPD